MSLRWAETTPRMPAEWEPSSAVWLAWPHNRETWPGRFGPVPAAFAQFVRQIAVSTPVKVLATGPVAHQAGRLLGASNSIELVDIPTNDCWIRDYGPTFAIRSNSGSSSTGPPDISHSNTGNFLVAVDWQFNAWGGKYESFELDAAACKHIASTSGLAHASSKLTLEGGALETDGRGRLLVHPDCVITPTRNPGWTKDSIAQELHRHLGVTEIAWIDGGGLEGDDTDGHIDQIARFVDHQNIVVAVPSGFDGDTPIAEGLEDNFRQLKLWGHQTDPGVNVHRLPMPPARRINGQTVPQSYCNFLRLGPDRLLLPTFACRKSDEKAIGILQDLCPDADIQGVPCEDIAWGLGALHCASCHQPSLVS